MVAKPVRDTIPDIEEVMALKNDQSLDDVSLSPKPVGYRACNLEGVELDSPPAVKSKSISHPLCEMTLKQWALATCFQLIYNMICTIFGAYILPQEAERLNGVGGSNWLGFYMSLCGISQLICPIAGKLSDQHSSRWGRRRPWMILGAAVATPSLVMMSLCSTFIWPSVFGPSLFVSMLALNVMYSAHCGIPADLQSREPALQLQASKGLVSGMMATYSFLGSLLAMLVLVLTQGMPICLLYFIAAACNLGAIALVCVSVQEEPTDAQKWEPISASEIMSTFLLDPVKDADFMWICIGRMFYYVSSSNASFQLYYIRDMLHIDDSREQRACLATLLVTIMTIGAIVAFASSSALGRYSRKTVIYYSCCIMMLCFFILMIAPMVGENGSWTLVLLAGVVGGFGNAGYLSVDYALALDCLPTGKTTAEAFGLWGVAGFLGSTLGPVIVGYVLSLSAVESGSPASSAEKYSYPGYAASMVLLGPVANLIVIACTSQIRGAK